MFILFLDCNMHHLKVGLVSILRFLLKQKFLKIYQTTPSQFK